MTEYFNAEVALRYGKLCLLRKGLNRIKVASWRR